ncbi:MAG: CBS domain-containing protein [Thermoplasmatales archaeon]|nr:CBS domain-containing protein [Thermoplasmatales archaeon]
MKKEILVKDIMSKAPVIVKSKASVIDAAKEMKIEKVGSVIVVENGKPVGILTESDILKKIVAEGKDASKIKVKDVMSTPLISISPDEKIEKAVKLLGKNRIRRLPVIENGKLVGIITERDIVQFSPLFIDLVEEWAKITKERIEYERSETMAGKCEECGMATDKLIEVDGRMLCEFCAEL